MESKQYLFSIPIILSLSHILVGFGIIGSLTRTRCDDELLSIVPLSPQQQVHGYWAFSCIQSIFLNSIYLPFIAIGQLLEPAFYALLLIPFVSFLFTQIATLIGLSISARIKQQWERNLLGFTMFLLLGFIMSPWFYVIYFESSRWQTFVWNQGFGFVSLFIVLPIILLLHGYIAYKLAIYGFKTWRKPFWHALLLNVVVYTLFNTIAAALWLGLAALVL
ncbi:MAG: hypothetical protein LBF88_12365 [Planctomycetaceae bacterium]|nr:hypothetical protein [Planctomycetaceae bacterium]